MKKNKKNNISYYGHLEILRWKIIWTMLVFLILFVISFVFINKIIIFLKTPINNIDIKLYFFKPYEKFLVYLKASFFVSLILTMPFAIFQFVDFVLPALTRKEKKFFLIFSFLTIFIFIIGCLFAFYIILPVAFNFFVNFSKFDNVNPILGISSYFDFTIVLVLSCGILFIFPIFLLFLIKMEILNLELLDKIRPYIIVFIFILAAIFTPPDILSQILIAIPLLLLFEITYLIGKIIAKNKEKFKNG